jgi:hypothetical protein
MASSDYLKMQTNISEYERNALWVEVTKELKEANELADHSEMPEVKLVSRPAPSLPKLHRKQKKKPLKQTKQLHKLRFHRNFRPCRIIPAGRFSFCASSPTTA